MSSGRCALVIGFPPESDENYLRQFFSDYECNLESGSKGLVRDGEKVYVLFTKKEDCSECIDKQLECYIERNKLCKIFITKCDRTTELKTFSHARPKEFVFGTVRLPPSHDEDDDEPGKTLTSTEVESISKLDHHSGVQRQAGGYLSDRLKEIQRSRLEKFHLMQEERERLREEGRLEEEQIEEEATETEIPKPLKPDDGDMWDEENVYQHEAGCGNVSVRVTGLNPATDQEMVEMFFENQERSGADSFKSIHKDETRGDYIVQFFSPEVVERVMKKENLTLGGAKLVVRPLTPPPPEVPEAEPDNSTIAVRGFKKDTTEEMLTLFFESQRRSGGGKVEKVTLVQDVAYITFKDPSVVPQILERFELVLRGDELSVMRASRPPAETTLLVKGAQGMNDEALRLFFESQKRSDGGKVREVVIMENGDALVTFEDPAVAQRVSVKEKLKFRGKVLKVSLVPLGGMGDLNDATLRRSPSPMQVLPPATVIIRGVDSNFTEEKLRLLLTNNRRSGGGPVEKIVLKPEYGLALVTFQQKEVSEQVIQFGDIKLGSCIMRAHPVTLDDLELFKDESLLQTDTGMAPKEKKPEEGCIVEVCGFSQETSDEILTLYFESEDHCGGGDVENVRVNGDRAWITFKNPAVAARVVSQDNLILNGKPVHVSWPSTGGSQKVADLPDPSSVLEVRGFHRETSEDTLRDYFENKRRSGGGDVLEVRISETKDLARIKFKESEDAYNVTQKENLLIEGARLNVRLCQPSPPPSESGGDELNETMVQIIGLNESISQEMFEDFLQNTKRTGGGEIEEIHVFDPEHQTAVVEFKNPAVAHRVISRGQLTLAGAQLTMTPASTSDLKPGTVYVAGLGSKVTEDMLMYYLENTKRSGGGDVESVEINQKTGTAKVKFTDPEAAARVCERQDLTVGGCPITVQKYPGARPKSGKKCPETYRSENTETALETVNPYEREPQSCAVKVTGVGKTTKEQTVKLYFENRRWSGGGEIQSIFHNSQAGEYIITFKDSDAVTRVIQKKHQLEESPLQVERMDSLATNPVFGPAHPNQLVVRGLTPSITSDLLKLHLENLTGTAVTSSCWGLDPSVVLLEFENPIDFQKVFKHFCSFPFDGVMLGVEQSPVSFDIQVFNIGGIADDTLCLYFENSRRSGGNENVKLKVKREEGYAILTCPTHEVLDSILMRSHSILGIDLYLSLYSPALGIIPPDFDTSHPVRVPESVIVNDFDPHLGHFIRTCPAAARQLNDILTPLHGGWRPTAEEPLFVRCLLNPNDQKAVALGRRWSDNVKEALCRRFLSLLIVKELQMLREVWSKVKDKIQKLSHDEVHIKMDEDSCQITISGYKTKVESIYKDVEYYVQKEQEELMRMSQTIVERIGLRPIQIRSLLALKYTKTAIDQFPKLKVTMKLSSEEEVVLEGLAGEIMDAKLMLYEMLQCMQSRRKAMGDLKLQLLSQKETRDVLVKALKDQNVIAVWEAEGQDLLVQAQSQKDLDAAYSLFETHVTHVPLDINEQSRQAMSTKAWNDLVSDLLSEHPGQLVIVPAANHSSVEVACLADTVTGVMEQIGRFFNQNTIVEKTVSLMPGPAKLIGLHMENELKNIEVELRDSYVHIQPMERLDGFDFLIKGNQSGLGFAEKKLKALSDSLMSREYVVNQPGLPKYYRSKRGHQFLEGVEAKCKVVILEKKDGHQVVVSSQSESNLNELVGSTMQTRQREEICRVHDRNGPDIIVYRGDLPSHHVDIIVNAANRDLDHIGGLARALVERGGEIIQKESREFIARNGRLLDGQVAVTSPGTLPCKKLIHAVGPIYQGGHTNDEDNILYEVVYMSLEKASEFKASSIALPAISTGLFRFPLNAAAKIIVEAINDYCKKEKSKNKLREIHLVDNSTKTTDAFRTALEKLYGKRHLNYGKQAPTQSTSQGRASLKFSDSGMSSSVNVSYKQTGNPEALITPEGITVTLIKGSIASQQADAIVNTTSKNLELKSGAVSSTILEAAGQGLQADCQKKYPKGIDYGEIAVTGSHNLKTAKFIFHGAIPNWKSSKAGSEKALRSLVQNSLSQANQHNVVSLAIPAIGTGNMKVPASFAAQAMYEEVAKYSAKTAKQTVKNVSFVIYDKDLPTVEAFTTEMKKLGSGATVTSTAGPSSSSAASPSSSSSAAAAADSAAASPVQEMQRRERGHVVFHAKPLIPEEDMESEDAEWETIGHEEVMFGEVDRMSHNQQQMTIGSILLQVQQGDITTETTDAIVNSSNRALDLSMGAVSKAIIRVGGKEIQDECSQLAPLTGGRIAVSGAGTLRCRHIFHLVAPHSFIEWRDIVRKCLEEADSRKLRSITFPALGTGQISAGAHEMASLMMDEIAKFCKKNPDYLKTVRVTIFQPSMLSVFHEQMVKKGKKKGFMESLKNMVFGSDEKEEISPSTPFQVRKKKQTANHNQIEFVIYGRSKERISEAIRKIDENTKEECQTKIIGEKDSDAATFIKNLTADQVSRIESLKKSFDVQIKVDKVRNVIEVKGSSTDLLAVVEKIHQVFHEADSREWRKQEAELLKKQVQWEYKSNGQWEAYPDEINCIIERAHREQKPEAKWEERVANQPHPAKYTVNFSNMKEVIDGTSDSVSVRRRDLTDDTIAVPDRWEPMNPDEHVKLVKLNPTDPEYKRVETSWKLTLGQTGVTLVTIERIQNPNLYRRYMVHKEHMEAVNPPNTKNELELWHGTAAAPIESINTQGFNRSFCGVNGVAYGNGVYFATNSSYSVRYAAPDSQGQRHMYLAKVLVGQYTAGKQGMKVPPPKDPNKPSILFDSVVNNVGNPGMYIIFSDTQAYPLYLLTFK